MSATHYFPIPNLHEITSKAIKPLLQEVSSHLPVEIKMFNDGQSIDNQWLSRPFRSNFFQIIYLTKGRCTCKVDFEQNEIHTQNLGFSRPGQITHITPEKDTQGYILRFTAAYLSSSVEKSSFINQSTLVSFSCLPLLHVNEADKMDMTSIIDKIASEYGAITKFKSTSFCLEVISGLLKVFLIYLSKISADQHDSKRYSRIEIVEKFFNVLEEKFKVIKNPADYASLLRISPGYLNEVLKKASGYTTSHFIHQRVLIEAKRLTIYSDTSMKEIAFALGYEDMSHFSKFFKRTSGECFSDYKKNLKLKS